MHHLIDKYKKFEPFFGNWYIKSLIGEGGYGAVFEIEREDFGRKYTSALKVVSIPKSESELKFIRDEGLDDESTATYYSDILHRMMDEFDLMSRLKGHSNIVSYEDHQVVPHEDSIGWDIFIRMELLTPIRDYQEKHPFTEADVIKIGVDICEALEVCKMHNIIHRDIKPENIFVSSTGHFKLGDFGIARTMDNAKEASTKAGTGRYMAPEVYRGEKYTASVDIYSLGLVLYRYLNDNRSPFLPQYPQPVKFSDNELAMERRMKGEALPNPAHASDAIAKILNKACAFNACDRYHSAIEMKNDLLAIQGVVVDKSLIGEKESNDDSEETIGIFNVIPTALVENHSKVENASLVNEDSLEKTVGVFSNMPANEKRSETVYDEVKSHCDDNKSSDDSEKTIGIFSELPQNFSDDSLNKKTSNNKKGLPKVAIIAIIFVALVGVGFACTPLIKDLLDIGTPMEADYSRIFKDRETPGVNIDGKNVVVGDVISFGSYDNKTLTWNVIDINDHEVTLMCVDAIEKRSYNDKAVDVSWESSSLRKWLNNDFLNSAFSVSEKEQIVTKTLANEGNSKYGVYGGNDTNDKVYILSLSEADNYADYNTCNQNWWLRTPGQSRKMAAYVHGYGFVDVAGCDVNDTTAGVRPVITIKASNITFN